MGKGKANCDAITISKQLQRRYTTGRLSTHPPVRSSSSTSQQLNGGRINSLILKHGNCHSPRTKLGVQLVLRYGMRGVLPTRFICTHSNNNTSSQRLHGAEDKFVNPTISFLLTYPSVFLCLCLQCLQSLPYFILHSVYPMFIGTCIIAIVDE